MNILSTDDRSQDLENKIRAAYKVTTIMKYNETLTNRVRENLADYPALEEKLLFGTLAFLVDGKLCICILPNGLLLRINPARYDELLENEGCREMKMGNRIMKGYVQVDEAVLHSRKQFNYWTGLALEYNKLARASKKAKKEKSKKGTS